MTLPCAVTLSPLLGDVLGQEIDVGTHAQMTSALVRIASRLRLGKGGCEHPEVYQNLMKVLATRLRLTDETVAAGSFLSLKGRVARTLLELADEFGRNVGSGRVVIYQKIGQSDLAAMTGIARENLSRVFNDWRRRKLVSRLAGYYCLENKARLKAEAEL